MIDCLQFKGKQVNHSDVILLYNYEKPVRGGMGIAFRLTEDHISPNSFAKMNVRLMAQVHSIIMKKETFWSVTHYLPLHIFRSSCIPLQKLLNFIA